MKAIALAALLVAGAAIPASAQYYGGGGYGYGPPRGGYDYDRRDEYRERRGRRDFDDDDDRRGPRSYGRRGGSGICVTSRGNCPIGAVVPRLTPCGCEVPGFGYKRGAAG